MSKPSILRSALILTGVNLLLRGISMLFQIYLSDLIGAAGIGLLQLVFTVGGFAMTLGLSGIRTAAMYLCAQEYGRGRLGGVRRAITLCLTWGLVCSALVGLGLYLAAEPIARLWLKDLRTVGALRLQAVSLPLNCYVSILSGYFTACGKIKKLVTVEVVERIASFLFTLPLLLYWAGASPGRACSAMILGGTLATAISAGWLSSILVRDLRVYSPVPKGLSMPRRLVKLCVPLALCDYLRSGLSTLEQFLIPLGLSAHQGGDQSAMAAYGTICGMVFPILMFPAALLYALSDLLIPELARCRAAGDGVRIRHLTDKCLRLGLLFACAVAAVLYLAAGPLGLLFYDSAAVGTYLRLFAPLVPVLYADALVDGMCKGLGQQVACARYNTITSALDVILLYLLLPRLGLGGYFITFIVTHMLNFYLSLRLLLDTTGYRPGMAFPAKALGCALGALLLARLLPPFSGLPGILLPGLTFLTAFWLLLEILEALSPADRRWLVQTFRR